LNREAKAIFPMFVASRCCWLNVCILSGWSTSFINPFGLSSQSLFISEESQSKVLVDCKCR
jgi:hypothetical protein